MDIKNISRKAREVRKVLYFVGQPSLHPTLKTFYTDGWLRRMVDRLDSRVKYSALYATIISIV